MVVPARPGVALSAILLALASPASALYDDMTFTPVITDEAGDAAGFNDIVELALGEPGDGTLVVRIQPAAFSPAPPAAAASIDYFVGDVRAVFRPDATSAEYDSCTIDGDYGYCILAYDTLGLEVGEEVPAANAISYAGSAVDCAPDATPGTACILTVGSGSAYTLKGCTATSCMGGNVSAVRSSNVTTPELRILQSFSAASNETYQFNWTSALEEADLEFGVEVSEGNVSLLVVDGTGAKVVNQTFGASGNVTEAVADAEGDWTFRLSYQGFVGNVTLVVRAPAAQSPATTTSTSSSARPPSTDDDRTGTFPVSKEKDTPMPGAVPLAVALLAVALALVRRRLD